MVAFNGGKVWDESCFFWQVRAEREGNISVAGEHNSLFFPYLLHVQGKKKTYSAVQNGTVCLFLFFF